MSNAIRVAIVDHSDLGADEVRSGMRALQTQVSRDFRPIWGVDAQLYLPDADEPPPCAWWLVLIDRRTEDAKAARGRNHPGPDEHYRDKSKYDLPVVKVMLDTVPAGHDWTHLASHQLLEALVDPLISGCALRPVGPDGCGENDLESGMLLYAHEICDPCEDYASSYECDGFHVSDFVFPAWFCEQPRGGDGGKARFDERSQVKSPFEVLPGGHAYAHGRVSRDWLPLGPDGAPVPVRPVPDIRLKRLFRAFSLMRDTDGIWHP